MTDRVGQQLGNYRLVRLLGEGGFAEVYLGEHLHLGTHAAIKLLHTQLLKDEIDKFRTEARTVARLEHPHIVRVFDFGVEDKTPYLVMSYAPNGTLRQRYPKGIQLPVPTIASYVKQVAEALQYAHDEKLIHRDVKPENMLLGRRQEILLSDFGIALMAQSSHYQNPQDMAGTLSYMAPEQIQGKPRLASDQYALGIVVYEWLSGTRPFNGSYMEIITQHLTVAPPPLREKVPTISPALEQVVMQALAKDPKARFGSVNNFALALEQASTSEPPPLLIISNADQPSRPGATEPSIVQPLPINIADISQKTREQWLNEAFALYEAKQYSNALTAFDQAIQLAPDYAYAYNGRGLTLYKLKRYPDALATLERAIQLNSNDATAHYGRGLALEQLQRYAEALSAYKRVTQLTPNYATAWRKKGDTLSELKRYEDALAAYEHALRLDPSNADAYIGKSNALKYLGRLK